MVKFGTKAETLEKITEKLKSAKIPPIFRFRVLNWKENRLEVLENIKKLNWINNRLIVRSSAINEDNFESSMAGHFTSILNVNLNKLEKSVNEVIESFDDNENNQVFIQPMLENVFMSGVAFSKDPSTGGNYIVINYDDTTCSTSSVTSGNSNELKAYYHFKTSSKPKDENIAKVINLVNELEHIFNTNELDIEFAITNELEVFLLQVRKLCLKVKEVDVEEQHKNLKLVEDKFENLNLKHPYLYGSKTLFGVMPDWNPAEIIGIRPRNLTMSLYKDIITDNIWAYQRNNYGYKNLRSFPLMVSFAGIPYIDVRVSFNSFLPSDLDRQLCEKLVNYYVQRLIDNPSLHDKVEFEIIFSCYTLDLDRRIKILCDYGFSTNECERILESIRNLTNRIINNENGLWKNDIEKINILEKRREEILNSSLDDVSKIYWLLEDCKRYGTLPFAGLARAGFIAVQMLRSLVNIGVLTESNYQDFMNNLNTISSSMSFDFKNLSENAFIKKYGHLRPGTYDILSPRYDEDEEKYFEWKSEKVYCDDKRNEFMLSLDQLNKIKELLKKHKLNQDVLGLFQFIKSSIEGREYSKFIFTKSLSDALLLFKAVGLKNNFTLEEISYCDINMIKEFYSKSGNLEQIFRDNIESGKRMYEITKSIILPSLIVNKNDIWSFEQMKYEPNFITLKEVTAETVCIEGNEKEIDNKILFIPSADPGYDWIFSHNTKGFVTMYGGVNSHMAIRAAELGIPAVIGAGEIFYNKWSKSKIISIDCPNKKVTIVK